MSRSLVFCALLVAGLAGGGVAKPLLFGTVATPAENGAIADEP